MAIVQHRGRDAQQQDALLASDQIWQTKDQGSCPIPIGAGSGLCAVADGVAASDKPQLASRALLETLRDMQQCLGTDEQDGWIGPRALRRRIHPALCWQLALQPLRHASATTLALLQWRVGRFSALNVGDSRIYCVCAQGDWRQLSLDHTYYQSMLQRGELEPGQDVGQLYHDLEHMIRSEAFEDDYAIHWQTGVWPEDATWVLCTDGLHDTLGDDQMKSLFDAEASLGELAGRYRQAVLDAGAPDNFSFILLR